MSEGNSLKVVDLGINTQQEPIVYIHRDSHICVAEGFSASAPAAALGRPRQGIRQALHRRAAGQLVSLADTLRELGAASVGLVVPYLCYMRQDARFHPGEAVTSRIFARRLSAEVDWLVTVDPHLHRHPRLEVIYSIPTRVVHGAPVLAEWLGSQQRLLLVGPDEESAQWVSDIAALSGHPWVVGTKTRYGDRQVRVELPDISAWQDHEAVIIDDVISSGHTVLRCIAALREAGMQRISCACVHGIFADGIDAQLRASGLRRLVSCNTVPHATNALDVAPLLSRAVAELL